MRPHNPPPPPGTARWGEPLKGLTADQLAAFAAGREEFENVETVASGLGPIFNEVSCVACHSARGTGGASAVTVTRFGRIENGVFDPLTELGGSLLQAHAIDPSLQEVIPDVANVVALRQTTPLFGLGLIEAIPDAAIRKLATRTVGDGIHGRAAMIIDAATGELRVGRFGWKNQNATLLTFAADAYLNEMGITNRVFPVENAPNGDQVKMALLDTVQDPEDTTDAATGKADIDINADFVRLLAPPPVVPFTRAARAGQALFQRINCTGCHVAVILTGPSPIAALNKKPVHLWSDLLLHDMGELGDGVAQADAGMTEFRTAPLWGLRGSGPYLHDGRAATIDEAITGHAGEAAASRDRYLKLTPAQKQQVVEFLNSI